MTKQLNASQGFSKSLKQAFLNANHLVNKLDIINFGGNHMSSKKSNHSTLKKSFSECNVEFRSNELVAFVASIIRKNRGIKNHCCLGVFMANAS